MIFKTLWLHLEYKYIFLVNFQTNFKKVIDPFEKKKKKKSHLY